MMFKNNIKILLGLMAVVFFASCEKDNYDAPDVFFKGNIVYNGTPINVQHDQVRFQLWEPKYNSLLPIDVAIAQDGSFSSVLFSGSYKLTFPGGQGPYIPLVNGETNSDTINVNLNGIVEMDIEVLPYYMVNNSNFSISGRTISASADLEQVITGDDAKGIERVNLYINKTQFVSGGNNIRNSEIGGGDITGSSVNLSVDVPDLVPNQNYIYARIGLKIQGVEDMIFSPVEKIDL
ncbi:DUF3823 domain-containing protein [Fulvivirga ligni]|uniref:DUF3823 domain-containing protein n=1 Tax=Fulvivirga ligni TaxID=2904246 RepID=UPI001F307E2D|nr:DUF3823 domain-containing protein [Fulvivirga ligni]UII21456.1 DUF3823 domain-containing protein [Fulvivirga ligni]